MDIKLSKKDINNIRGSLRQSFHRSEYYKTYIDSKKIYTPRYKADGSRHKVDNVIYACESCNGHFKQSEINVDHIEPIGSLIDLEGVSRFIRRLYCSYDNLQILCKTCHDEKTKRERAIARSLDKILF